MASSLVRRAAEYAALPGENLGFESGFKARSLRRAQERIQSGRLGAFAQVLNLLGPSQ
ncbi:MAG: hypothetical protein ACYDGR_03245 [Candidatus Dormibacteria bacterium]